ncbi:MAG TPA: Hsp20/alpha crystallin family protein [Chloroflexota bacterium]
MAMSPFDPRFLARWDPFSDMTSLRDAMNRLMESAYISPGTIPGGEALSMPIDMAETEDHYTIQASLPGLKPEDVKISIQNNVLTIEGERKSQREQKEGERRILSEHRFGKVTRSFSLPTPVDSERAQADFEHGVLRLTLPKAEAAKPKQIRVQGGVSGGQQVFEGQTVQREQVGPPKRRAKS